MQKYKNKSKIKNVSSTFLSSIYYLDENHHTDISVSRTVLAIKTPLTDNAPSSNSFFPIWTKLVPVVITSSTSNTCLPFICIRLNVRFSILFFPIVPFIFSLSNSIHRVRNPSAISNRFANSLQNRVKRLPCAFFVEAGIGTSTAFSFIASKHDSLEMHTENTLAQSKDFSPSLNA